MSSYYMLNNYMKVGKDFESFKEEAAIIDNATVVKKVPTDLTNALFCYNQSLGNSYVMSKCQVVYDGSVYPSNSGGFERVENVILNSGVGTDSRDRKLLLELKENFLLNFEEDFCSPEKNFFLDNVALKTLADKLTIKRGLLEKDNFTKALLITAAFSDIESINIVYRTNGAYNRIIAFVGDKYKRTPLSKVCELVDAANKMFRFEDWMITNKGSHVNLKYKEYTIKISTSDNCEFADSVSVYLDKNIEYRLLSKVIGEIEGAEEFFKQLKEKIDRLDALLGSMVTYDSMKGSINAALGSKTSKIALSYIESQDDAYKAILEIPEMIELSPNQKQEYSKIFYMLGEKACA